MKAWRLPADPDGPRGVMDQSAPCTGCRVSTWMAMVTADHIGPCCDWCMDAYEEVPDVRVALPRSRRCGCGVITGLGSGGVPMCDACDREARRTEAFRRWANELADRRQPTTA